MPTHEAPAHLEATAVVEPELEDADLAGFSGAGPSFWTCYTPKC